MYGSVSGVIGFVRVHTRNGEFFDAAGAVEATNPSLSQVTEWLEQISTMLDLALATEYFVVPITDTQAVKALDGIVNALVSDLVNAANASGRFFSERILEGGRNPMLLIRSDILAWVTANADGLDSYPDVIRNGPEGRQGSVVSSQMRRADTEFAQDEYSRPSYTLHA